jgi:Lon protease-like protein
MRGWELTTSTDATAARIVRLERLSTGGFLAVVEGLSRIRLVSFTPCPSYIEAHIELSPAGGPPPRGGGGVVGELV